MNITTLPASSGISELLSALDILWQMSSPTFATTRSPVLLDSWTACERKGGPSWTPGVRYLTLKWTELTKTTMESLSAQLAFLLRVAEATDSGAPSWELRWDLTGVEEPWESEHRYGVRLRLWSSPASPVLD